MTLLEDVRSKLNTAGLLSGWKCYIGYQPDDADRSMALTYTGGFPQDTHQGENLLLTFQLSVRAGAQEHDVCTAQWYAVFAALQDATDITGVSLIQAMATGPMSFRDDKNRPVMTANFRVVKANG